MFKIIRTLIYKYNFLSFLIISLTIILFVYRKFVFGENIFIFWDIRADWLEQFFPSYLLLSEHFKNHIFWFYSFTLGLGQPIYIFPEHLSYFPVYFLKDINSVSKYITTYNVLKVVLISILSYFFLRARIIPVKFRLLLGLSFTFHSYVQVNSQWTGHATEPLSLMLLVYSLELVLKNKRYGFIILFIACFYIIQSHFFNIYPFSLFLIIYLSLKKALSEIKFSQMAIIMFCWGIYCLILSFYLFPSLAYMLSSPRVTSELSVLKTNPIHSFFKPYDYQNFEYLVIQFASLFHKNIFGIGDEHLYWNYLESPSLYIPHFVLILLIVILINNNFKKTITFFGIFLIYFLFPFPKTIFYGFGYYDINRLANLFFIFLLLYYLSFELKRNMFKINGFKYKFVLVTFFLILFLYSLNKILGIRVNQSHLLCVNVFLVLYSLIIFIPKWKLRWSLIIFTTILEILIYYNNSVNFGNPSKKDFLNQVEEIKEITDYIQKHEKDSLYRIVNMIPPFDIIQNDSWYFGYQSLELYSFISKHYYYTNNFYGLTKHRLGHVFNELRLFDENFFNFMSTKFILSDRQLTNLNLNCYEVNILKAFWIYKNLCYEKYFRIMTDIKTFHSESDIKGKNFEQEKYKKLYIKDEVILSLKYNSTKDLERNNISYEILNNRIKIRYSISENSILFAPVVYDQGFVAVNENGEKLNIIPVNGGLLGIEMPKDNTEINIYFEPPYWKMGLLFSFVGIFLLALFYKYKLYKLP